MLQEDVSGIQRYICLQVWDTYSLEASLIFYDTGSFLDTTQKAK